MFSLDAMDCPGPRLSSPSLRRAPHYRIPPSRVDAPRPLTIDEAAFLAARVQARELARERVERLRYVDKIPASDGDEHAVGLELERSRCRAHPNPERGGEGRGDAGQGRRGASFSSSGSDISGVSIAQAGGVVTVARGATVPYQNNVTGSPTTGSVVIVTFRDRP